MIKYLEYSQIFTNIQIFSHLNEPPRYTQLYTQYKRYYPLVFLSYDYSLNRLILYAINQFTNVFILNGTLSGWKQPILLPFESK